MTMYYVATNGSDSAAGTSAAPFRSIEHASEVVDPGDTVIVRAGTYRETIWIHEGGTAGSEVTFKSETPGGALLRPASSDAYSTLNVRANYVNLEGFDVVGGGGHGVDIEGHHVTVRGITAHDSGGSGIATARSDWLTIENNVVYGNAATNGYATSGISLWQNVAAGSGTAEFRNIIRNNIVHDNAQGPQIDWDHTDGNGIIIDGFQDTNYTRGTLIDNNLSYHNGGKGIHVFLSDYVTVRNNTVWHNNWDNANPGSWRGELSNAIASHNTWINNIAVADTSTNSWNRAINNVTTGGYVNQDVHWSNNLTFNGTVGDVSVLSDYGLPSAANGNLLGVNPMFVGAPSNFHLQAGSPAVNAGSSAEGLASSDLDGGPRVVGTVDIGAFETGTGPSDPTGVERHGNAGDNALSGTNFADSLYGGGGNDVLRGRQGDDILSGDTGNDELRGGKGDDSLAGGSGRDVLHGQLGNDLLTGGGGGDTFVFENAAIADGDTIGDFLRSQGDRIDLGGIDANEGAAGNQGFTFIGSALFSGVFGELRYAAGKLSGDTDHDGVADFTIAVTGNPVLGVLDLIL